MAISAPAGCSTDVLATAAYFGWGLGGFATTGTTPAEVETDLNDLFAAIQPDEVPETLFEMALDAAFLSSTSTPQYGGIELVFYEGGQHLADWDGPEEEHSDRSALFAAANDDSRMGTAYDQLFAGWLAQGSGTLFLHYVNVHESRPWGSFGSLEYQDQPHATSPKYQALMSVIDSFGAGGGS